MVPSWFLEVEDTRGRVRVWPASSPEVNFREREEGDRVRISERIQGSSPVD